MTQLTRTTWLHGTTPVVFQQLDGRDKYGMTVGISDYNLFAYDITPVSFFCSIPHTAAAQRLQGRITLVSSTLTGASR